jgi:hypothetical protein
MNKISLVQLVYFKIHYSANRIHIDLSCAVYEWYYFMCFMCIYFYCMNHYTFHEQFDGI